MATSDLNRTINAFVPEVMSAQLLVELEQTYVYAQGTNRNYEGEISQYGDTVRIVSLNEPTIGTYSAHNDITVEPVSDSDQILVIDQSKYFAFEVDDIEQRQARGNVMDEQARKSGYELAGVTDTFLANLMKTGVAGSNQLSQVNHDSAALIDMIIAMKVRLDEENVPTRGRWLVINPSMHALLLHSPQFVRVDESGTSQALRNGQVGRAFGFDIVLSNNAPATSGTPSTHTAIAGYDGATTFAEQIAKVEAFSMELRFNDAVKGLHLYGGKVIRPTGLVTAEVADS